MTDLVSIIIPAYNSEAYVAEAVVSALGQTNSPVEVIVVDDGSTDGTADALRQFGDVVRVVRTDGVGAAGARNAGVSKGAATKPHISSFGDARKSGLPGDEDQFKPEIILCQLKKSNSASMPATACCAASKFLTTPSK